MNLCLINYFTLLYFTISHQITVHFRKILLENLAKFDKLKGD